MKIFIRFATFKGKHLIYIYYKIYKNNYFYLNTQTVKRKSTIHFPDQRQDTHLLSIPLSYIALPMFG